MDDLFLKILNMSIAAGYLVLAVVALRLLLKKKAPRWSMVLLWGIVALRLICLFSIESALSLIPSAETVSPEILVSPTPSIHSGISAFNTTINPVISETFAPTPSHSVTPMQTLISAASIIWLAGMSVMLLYVIISYWRLRRQVSSAVLERENIYRSERVTSAFVLGFLRPRIYLPCGINDRDAAHVIAHERAHIRRRDHWWKPLGFLLLTVHWFNPLMWLAYALLCRDIELACDEKTIKELEIEQRADYSETLLKCSVSRRSITACPLAFGEVSVKERVNNVLSYKKPAFWIIAVAVAICIVVAVCFLTDPVAHAENTQPGGTQPSENIPGPAEIWYQIAGWADRDTGEFQLEAFPGVTFRWNVGTVEAITKEATTTIMDAVYLKNIGAVDLNLDGYPEICATAVRSTEEHSCYVIVYDYAAGKSYSFPAGDGNTGYYLYTLSNYVMCGKERLQEDETYESGRLMLTGTEENMALTILLTPPPAEYKGNPVLWIDISDPDAAPRAEVQLDAFPGVTFRWNFKPNWYLNDEFLIAEKDGVEIPLFDQHGAISSVYVADVTGDGKPDICANGYHFFSGLPSFNAVYVYDYANGKYYSLGDNSDTNHHTKVSYYIRMENGQLLCDQIHEATRQTVATGTLTFVEGRLHLDAQITYDSPVEYELIIKDEYLRDIIRLVTKADGTCWFSTNMRLNSDGTSNTIDGTYEKKDGKLIMYAEDGRRYTFRIEGDNLIFIARLSAALPKGCKLTDGAVLTGTPYLTPDQIG